MYRNQDSLRRGLLLLALAAISGTAWGQQQAKPAPQPETAYKYDSRLAPGLEWLRSEGLRGTLFHKPNIKPLKQEELRVIPAAPAGAPTAVTLRGEHFLAVLVDKEKEIKFQLESVRTEPLCPYCPFAVFGPQGETLAADQVESGKSRLVAVPAVAAGRYLIMLNSGIASKNVARVSVVDLPWAIENKRKQDYLGTPVQYHFLRELKQAGLNLVMPDVEYLTQEFVTDEGLKKWTERVAVWAEHAKRYQIRIIPAIDLGGTQYEVDAWGDAPKGLYFDESWYQQHDKGHLHGKPPVAPCPLSKVYWERILMRRARELARMSIDNPYVVGVGIDPEMYMCHIYGHYKPGGTCYCDHCVGGFLRQKQLDAKALEAMPLATARHDWLVKQKSFSEYEKYLENETATLCGELRDALHKINPRFLICVYVLEIGNWSCRGMARGFGKPEVPVINFAEHTYYGVGFDPKYVAKQNKAFADWGSHVVPGYAVWDIFFPPIRRSCLAAHCYNLALSGGYWFWPGCDLLTDHLGGPRWLYQGKAAPQSDYWLALKEANTELDRRMTVGDTYVSPLANAERVPWRYIEREGKWKEGSGVERNLAPTYPIHLAGTGEFRFFVPDRVRSFTLLARATSGDGTLAVASSAAKSARELACPAGRDVRLEVPVTGEHKPGVWTLSLVSPAGPEGEIALQIEGLPVHLTPQGAPALAMQIKQGDLVGRWRLDEGRGDVAADSSGPPACDGAVFDAAWAPGKSGSALSFDGKRSRVKVDHNWSMDNLDQYTLAAWVELRGLPTKGHGMTLVSKGPEAAVQHCWWWIGYNHELVLEVGSPERKGSVSFGTPQLAWDLNRWYHVAVTFRCDGQTSTATFYRDGQPIASSVKKEPFHAGNYDLFLGSYMGSIHTLDGLLDEVLFYNRAASAEEIKALASQP